MSAYLVINMRHYLGEHLEFIEIPGPAVWLRDFIGSIIAAAGSSRSPRDYPAIDSPPLTEIVWPVMKPASSLDRKQTMPGISSG